MASQGASSGASAIPADQPVDLAARPKSSPSAASPSTPKPVTATLQVKNSYSLLMRDALTISELPSDSMKSFACVIYFKIMFLLSWTGSQFVWADSRWCGGSKIPGFNRDSFNWHGLHPHTQNSQPISSRKLASCHRTPSRYGH